MYRLVWIHTVVVKAYVWIPIWMLDAHVWWQRKSWCLGTFYLYAVSNWMSLLCVTRVLSDMMMTAVSSIVLIASKILWWKIAGWIFESFFSGRMYRVQKVVKRSLSTSAVVAWVMRRLQILVLVVSFSTQSQSIWGSGETGVCALTIVLGST